MNHRINQHLQAVIKDPQCIVGNEVLCWVYIRDAYVSVGPYSLHYCTETTIKEIRKMAHKSFSGYSVRKYHEP